MVEFRAKEIFSTVENLEYFKGFKGSQSSSTWLTDCEDNAQEDGRFVITNTAVIIDKVLNIQLMNRTYGTKYK